MVVSTPNGVIREFVTSTVRMRSGPNGAWRDEQVDWTCVAGGAGFTIAFPDGRHLTMSAEEWAAVGCWAVQNVSMHQPVAMEYRRQVARQVASRLLATTAELHTLLKELEKS